MKNKRITRLNEQFRQRFGECPLGAKYKWLHTTEAFYWLEDCNYDGSLLDGMKATRIESLVNAPANAGVGLCVPEVKYVRHAWAERKGLCWTLAKWTWRSEAEWKSYYNSHIPWPKDGEYQLIENVFIPDNREPDENDTSLAIWAITQNLGKSLADHQAEGDWAIAEHKRSTLSDIDNEIHDLMTAFGKVPGISGGSVSLPYTKFDRN